MARRTNLAAEIATIDKSGLKTMQLTREKAGWVVRTTYDCGCEGVVNLATLLTDGDNRFLLQALRLAYSCGKHGPKTKTEPKTEKVEKTEIRASA